MIKKFFQGVRDVLHPFSTIAQELRILRELYELDLAARPNPIIRVTEDPSKDDTVITYGEEPEKDEDFPL